MLMKRVRGRFFSPSFFFYYSLFIDEGVTATAALPRGLEGVAHSTSQDSAVLLHLKMRIIHNDSNGFFSFSQT